MGFPISPAPSSGDTYSVENRVWTYDGYGWRFLGASGSIDVTLIGNLNYTVGNTFPISPTTGDKWFHLNDAVEYTYIQDIEDTSHWIEIGYGCPTIGGQAYGLTGINFPNTECVGDLYEYDSRIWVYNGYAWKMVCQNTGDTDFTFGLTAPINPDPGHRWVDSATGLLYTFIDDEDPIGQTGQWVNFSGSNFVLGPTGPTGDPGPIGPTGSTGEYYFFTSKGVCLNSSGLDRTFTLDLLTTDLTTKTPVGDDFIVIQSKTSGSIVQRTALTSIFTAKGLSQPTTATSLSTKSFILFDSSDGSQVSSSFNDVKNELLSGAVSGVSDINGCTGSIGITGTENEIEVTQSCPEIIIGLPDNVTISGDLTVNGFYYGFIDGGTFG